VARVSLGHRPAHNPINQRESCRCRFSAAQGFELSPMIVPPEIGAPAPVFISDIAVPLTRIGPTRKLSTAERDEVLFGPVTA
jgi:hypothetical protein